MLLESGYGLAVRRVGMTRWFLNKKDGSKLHQQDTNILHLLVRNEGTAHCQKCIKDTVMNVCSPQMLVGAHKRRSTLFNYCQAIRADTWSDSRVEATKRFGGGGFVLPKRSECQQSRGKCHACVCMYNSTCKEQKCNIQHTDAHTHTKCVDLQASDF